MYHGFELQRAPAPEKSMYDPIFRARIKTAIHDLVGWDIDMGGAPLTFWEQWRRAQF